jgi:hypothetical protein
MSLSWCVALSTSAVPSKSSKPFIIILVPTRIFKTASRIPRRQLSVNVRGNKIKQSVWVYLDSKMAALGNMADPMGYNPTSMLQVRGLERISSHLVGYSHESYNNRAY